MTWPRVRLGEVMQLRRQFIEIDDLSTYRRPRVQLHARGVVLRDEIRGARLKTKKQQVCAADEFLVAEIDAKVGGFGMVPPELAGAIVSSHYFLYQINRTKLEPSFFGYFVRTPAFGNQVTARGSTNYAAVRSDQVLEYELPLPPIVDQRRIVSAIDRLSSKITQLRDLQRDADELTRLSFDAQVSSEFSRLSGTSRIARFGDLGAFVTSGPRSWGQHYADEGYRFYRAQDIGPSGATVEDTTQHILPPEGNQGRRAQPEPGDLLVVITGATLGRVALFTERHESGFVSQHVALCRLPQEIVLPEYALWWLRGPDGQRQLLESRYGQGKPGLNLTNIKKLALPVPDVDVQRRVVDRLNGLDERTEQLLDAQEGRRKYLKALLPSILGEAFSGGL